MAGGLQHATPEICNRPQAIHNGYTDSAVTRESREPRPKVLGLEQGAGGRGPGAGGRGPGAGGRGPGAWGLRLGAGDLGPGAGGPGEGGQGAGAGGGGEVQGCS